MTSSEPLDPRIAALYEDAERLGSPGARIVQSRRPFYLDGARNQLVSRAAMDFMLHAAAYIRRYARCPWRI